MLAVKMGLVVVGRVVVCGRSPGLVVVGAGAVVVVVLGGEAVVVAGRLGVAEAVGR
jgi:hypothetical protein